MSSTGKIQTQDIANGAVTANEMASGAAVSNIGFTPENPSNKGADNGYASLDGAGNVPKSQLGNVPPSNLLTMPNAWIG